MKLGRESRFHFDPSPVEYLECWQTLEIEFYNSSESNKVTDTPDISVGNGKMFLSESAYKVLNQLLCGHGEFLPVTYSDKKGYLFNSLTIAEELNALDPKLCIRNEWDEMEHLGFIEERLQNAPLFRTAFENYMGFFCSEEFKDLVEASDLKGITFSVDISNIFPPDPTACAPTSH